MVQRLREGESLDNALKLRVKPREKPGDSPGAKKKVLAFPRIKGREKAIPVAKAIINGELAKLPWDDVDWDDLTQVEKRLEENILKLVESIG